MVLVTGAKIDEEASQKLAFNKIYLFNFAKPVAFALSPKIILVSVGLRNLLNKQELQAIIDREIYNIKNHKTGPLLVFDLTSWKREFAADAYAAEVSGDTETLIAAIIKAGRISTIFPPIEDRIRLLKAM